MVPLFGMLMQLAFLGLIIWAIARLVGRGRTGASGVDQVAAVRRLFVYGLLFVTLILTAVGSVFVLQALTGGGDGDDDGTSALALGLALVIVAGPAYGWLLRHARRRLQARADERSSLGWIAYLNLSLLVSLIITTVTAQQMLEGVTGVGGFELDSLAPVVVWGAVWASHWFWLKAAYGLPGELHLAAGSLTGLITLAVGLGGLAFVAGDEIYTSVVERVPAGHEEPELRTWAVTAAIGGLVWAWHWLWQYRRAPRTPLWHVYVVLVGALGGLLAAVASAATIGYWTGVWFLGDPAETLASEHFEYVPVAAAVLLVGTSAWQHHRVVLQRAREIERTEPLRTYDYLMAGSGLVATVVGMTIALVALLEAVTPEPVGTETQVANLLVLATILAAIGGLLRWVFWSRIGRHASADPAGELGSMVRRIHLIVLFGVGGAVVLGGLISVLFIGLEDLLDGTFGGETVRAFRVGLALVATVTGVAWYHLRVYRRDRDALAGFGPVPPPLPPRHVVLIAPHGMVLAEELAVVTGAHLDSWYRTDETAIPDVDLASLAAQIADTDTEDVLVVVGPEGSTVVPYET